MKTHYQPAPAFSQDASPLTAQNQPLKGKTALVSYGGHGAGKTQALFLAAQGAAVIVADNDLNQAEQTAEDIRHAGGRAIAVAVDINEPAQAAMLVKYSPGIFGGLDILVNCTGEVYTLNDNLPHSGNSLQSLLTDNINAATSARKLSIADE